MRQFLPERGGFWSTRTRQPQLRRRTSWVGSTTSRGDALRSARRDRTACTASAPSSCIGWRTVVSGGARWRVAAMSSKPVTATVPGTFTFACLRTASTPIAISSLPQTIASGSGAVASSSRTAWAPPDSVKLPMACGRGGAAMP